ncbi:hypothetical protein J5U18_07190 [Sphingobacteriaceae bacterium WQ 2009]|uniref:Uncharacterized protein n=1 Tax=Rhinopithecimicrobium faecis TaxID=2820698 RepID=A0A8T4HDC1_9SPHI|nr:hypothetical protein [Sphingobacteriaceae bacterium WQ 2009]
MATSVKERQPKTTDNNANQTHYYITMVVAVVFGMAGVFFRFLPDEIPSLDQHGFLFTSISNVFLIIGSVLAFRTVFGILGFRKG